MSYWRCTPIIGMFSSFSVQFSSWMEITETKCKNLRGKHACLWKKQINKKMKQSGDPGGKNIQTSVCFYCWHIHQLCFFFFISITCKVQELLIHHFFTLINNCVKFWLQSLMYDFCNKCKKKVVIFIKYENWKTFEMSYSDHFLWDHIMEKENFKKKDPYETKLQLTAFTE